MRGAGGVVAMQRAPYPCTAVLAFSKSASCSVRFGSQHRSSTHRRHASSSNRTDSGVSTAPDLTDELPAAPSTSGNGSTGRRPGPPPPPGSGPGKLLKRAIRAAEKRLSNLQLAIGELAALAVFSAIGTIIDQDQTTEWYINNYPDGPEKVLGFLDYNLLFVLELDHIYTSSYFLGLCTLLAASLVACSRTQQFPLLKIAKRWRFPERKEQVFAKGNGETLPGAAARDLGKLLRREGYEVFLRKGALYAFKGIAGRFAPIAVHVSLLMILGGAAFGALCGFEGRVMIPQGGEFLVANALRSASTALPSIPLPEGAAKVIRLDKFQIDYRPDGSVGQYRSVLTQMDLSGRREGQKEIYVNEPMRFGGVTIYQVDWELSVITLRIGSPGDSPGDMQSVATGMAEVGDALGMNSSSKLFGTFIPLELPNGPKAPKGLSILAKDPQQVVFYDASGAFVGVRRPGSSKPIVVEGRQFIVDDVIGSSGMQLKHDPGVIYVYAGFGFLMITSIVSYVSHSQVWALQEGENLYVGGRTNRALLTFQKEYDNILDAVPETAGASTD